jgi:demethylspheroidene O-methyltransferase
VSNERARDYTALMAGSQSLIGAEILDAYPVKRHHCLLDVGGGDGSFAALAAQRAPRLRVICFDLPAVAHKARQRFVSGGLDERVQVAAGNFFEDPLPRGADLISLIRVLHDHDDAAVLQLLMAARAALPESGTVLIAEPLSGTRGGERVADAYFGFYLLAMGQGKPRSSTHLARLLAAAGFRKPRLRRTRMPMNVRVLSAGCAPQSSKSVKAN